MDDGQGNEQQLAVHDPAVESGVKFLRTTFQTSRLLDFCSEKELTAQTGHDPNDWPLVILKELMDNGPGIPAKTVAGILDYSRSALPWIKSVKRRLSLTQSTRKKM